MFYTVGNAQNKLRTRRRFPFYDVLLDSFFLHSTIAISIVAKGSHRLFLQVLVCGCMIFISSLLTCEMLPVTVEKNYILCVGWWGKKIENRPDAKKISDLFFSKMCNFFISPML